MPMPHIPRPPFLIRVIWHPEASAAAPVADRIRAHFGTHRFRSVAGGTGVEVVFRRTPGSRVPVPFPADPGTGGPVAVVALINRTLVEDTEWVRYLDDLRRHAATGGPAIRLLPVSMETGVLDDLELSEQAIRWDLWDPGNESREQRLVRELAYEFARMLRDHLHVLRQPTGGKPQLEQSLKKIQAFISYSSHDGHGKDIAEAIRSWLHQNSAVSSFLDVHDLPAGLPFPEVIDHHIGRSIMLAVYTDSYSSSEWCRHEVLEAKRRGVPMIVVDCLDAGDERAFPYLGNVPVVRMDPMARNRLPHIAGRLVDEVLLDFLWRCRVEAMRERRSDTVFLARPPELVSLATLSAPRAERRMAVYPDPPLDAEETELLNALWPGIRIRSLNQWLTEESS